MFRENVGFESLLKTKTTTATYMKGAVRFGTNVVAREEPLSGNGGIY